MLFLIAAVALAACQPTKTEPKPEAAKEKASVPKRLFEVELGKVYTMKGQDFTKSDLPIAKFTGAQEGIGSGTHFYFQPRKAYEAFPYEERREKPQDEFFGSSYRLYLLPVIPSGIKSLSELEKAKDPGYEVLVIEWSRYRDGDKTQNDDYFWAQSMCKTFEADLGVKPKLFDQYRPQGDTSTILGSVYSCTFAEGDRELEVTSMFGRMVKLSFTNEASKAKHSAFEMTVRKLQAPAIRPY